MVLTLQQVEQIELHFYQADDTELWQRVKAATWKRYNGSRIGALMYRRYVLGEKRRPPGMNIDTYYRYRNEFILYAALELARNGVDVFELGSNK